MPALITDKFTETTNGTRPLPTTLTALRSVGAGTISVGALTGWATATAVHFIIYRIDGNGKKVANSQTDWKGIVSGTTITGLVLKAGTDLGDSIGAVVECAPTAAWADDVVEGIAAEHKQDGTHKAITADSVTVATGDINAVGVGKLKDNGTSLVQQRADYFFDYIVSGGIWTGNSYGATLLASMTAMVLYINGRRISINAISGRTFTASKDTYVDVLDNGDGTGTVSYSEVSNNAASPALAASSVRIAIIITGASSIANVGSINDGDADKLLPIASSQPYQTTDSLGNLINPRDPNRKILALRKIYTQYTGAASATWQQVTGMSLPFIAPGNRNVVTTFFGSDAFKGAGGSGVMKFAVFDGAVGGTSLNEADPNIAAGTAAIVTLHAHSRPAAGSKTYNVGANPTSAHPIIIEADAARPTWAMVELK